MHDILAKLQSLEPVARQLEPAEQQRKEIFSTSESYVQQFINSLPARKAYIKADCPQLRTLVLQDEGQSFDSVISLLETEIHHSGINAASGGHVGYIPGGGLWLSSIGDMLAAVGNRYAGIAFSGKGAVILENRLVHWLTGLVGYPSTAHGNIASGGSIATMIALTTARDVHKIDSTNVRRSVIYMTSQTHQCVHKALHIIGLKEAVIREVPVDDYFRMQVDVLESLIQSDVKSGYNPFLVIANAGTTNTGAIDPLDAIADVCHAHNLWYHVDAAYGGFFLLVEALRPKFKGIERSDSVVLDPHKGLFLPFGTGVVLVKNANAMLAAHQTDAAYLVDTMGQEEINPSDCSPELTKHFRGLRMWLPLHVHGLNAFRACLEEKILLCQYFHTEIKKLGFETGPDPELSVTYFRFPAENKNEFNKQLVERLHQDGRIFFSSTILNGDIWIRCAVLSFRTHLREIKIGLEMIKDCLDN